MDVLKGIRLLLSALYSCMGYTFNFSGYTFTLGSVMIASLLISVSLTLLRFMLRD